MRELDRSGIYQIVNKNNGKIYVGSAVNLLKRKHTHFAKLKTQTHNNPYLQSVYNKNPDVFGFYVLEFCDREDLLSREQIWLDVLYDEQDRCYNIGKIASHAMLGRNHSEETKQRMREHVRSKEHCEKNQDKQTWKQK